jgi:hypothetical protein
MMAPIRARRFTEARMLGKSSFRLPRVAMKEPRSGDVHPAHHAAHLIPDQLIPWLLAASLLLGLAMLILVLAA